MIVNPGSEKITDEIGVDGATNGIFNPCFNSSRGLPLSINACLFLLPIEIDVGGSDIYVCTCMVRLTIKYKRLKTTSCP